MKVSVIVICTYSMYILFYTYRSIGSTFKYFGMQKFLLIKALPLVYLCNSQWRDFKITILTVDKGWMHIWQGRRC